MGNVVARSGRRACGVLRLAALTELTLMALTWKLWFAASRFPRVPLLDTFVEWPAVAVMGISAVFLSFTLCCVIRPPESTRRAACALSTGTIVAGLLAVACNQHVLQPWHWMFLLIVLFRVVVPEDRVMRVWRVLAATIYLFAALSRVGPRIDEGMSRQMALSLIDLSGGAIPGNNPDVVSWLCIVFTLVEFLIGCSLLIPRTERIGSMAGIAMHGVLLLVLGPFGLQQNSPVLVWNLFLAVWLWLLFLGGHGASEDLYAAGSKDWPVRSSRRALLAAGFCVVWPALGLIGVADAWTGWQLYSPRPAVVHLQVRGPAREEIPIPAAFIAEPRPLDDWQDVRMDRWSLEEAGAPLYPSVPFQMAVAHWLTRELEASAETSVRARIDAPAVPLWWNRTIRDLPDARAIQEAAGTDL